MSDGRGARAFGVRASRRARYRLVSMAARGFGGALERAAAARAEARTHLGLALAGRLLRLDGGGRRVVVLQ